MEGRQLVFVTGVGRSGTTLLQSMLHAHSQIHFPPETHFFKRYVLPFLLYGKRPGWNELENDEYLKRLDPALRQMVIEAPLQIVQDYREVFVKILQGSDNEVLFGDKDTEYVRYIPHVKKVYPKARWLHIIRDPRDVIASRLQTEWGGKRGLAFHVAEYQYYIAKVQRDLKQCFPKTHHELRYEDLLAQPEEELQRVMDFLQLPFEPQMLSFYKGSATLVAKNEEKWKQKVSQPLDAKNHGKWRESLSLRQAALIEEGLQTFMEEYQYVPVGQKCDLPQRLQRNVWRCAFQYKTWKETLR